MHNQFSSQPLGHGPVTSTQAGVPAAATAARRQAKADVITQQEVERLRALRLRCTQLEAEWEAGRLALIRRLQDGAVVEPGRFAARLRQTMRVAPTFAGLAELFGDEFVATLRTKLTPRPQLSLMLSDSDEELTEGTPPVQEISIMAR